jgi:hypothetical protein
VRLCDRTDRTPRTPARTGQTGHFICPLSGLSGTGRTSTGHLSGLSGVSGPAYSQSFCGLADALRDLARRLSRLAPSSRDPETFHVEKNEIEVALRRLARRLT